MLTDSTLFFNALPEPSFAPLSSRSFSRNAIRNKYWVATLSSSPLLASRDYVAGQVGGGSYMGLAFLLEGLQGEFFCVARG